MALVFRSNTELDPYFEQVINEHFVSAIRAYTGPMSRLVGSVWYLNYNQTRTDEPCWLAGPMDIRKTDVRERFTADGFKPYLLQHAAKKAKQRRQLLLVARLYHPEMDATLDITFAYGINSNK